MKLHEERNVYGGGAAMLRHATWEVTGNAYRMKTLETTSCQNLLDWNHWWGLDETGSVAGNVGFQGGNLIDRIGTSKGQLSATILDLPDAVRHAAPLLERKGMGDRIRHREGDLLEELGTETYDLIFMAAVVHHFDGPTNRRLMKRIERALKPGGLVAIWEPVRQERSGKIRQIGGLLDLFFGFFSQAGTWSAEEIADWMRTAGLEAVRSRSPRLMPDLALHVASKNS